MRTSWLPYVLAALSALTCKAAESDSLVEVRGGTTVTTGKLLAKDKQRAILLDRTGRLHDLTLGSVKLQETNRSFQSLPVMELRNQLSREFGKELEIGSTRHYLVLAPSGRATDYAKVFEEQYSTLQRYFKLRGFTLTDPQFPLVAVVFPSQKQFTEYARGEGSKTMANMQGYYSPRTNRVALFESVAKSVAVSMIDPLTPSTRRMPLFGTTETVLKSTMIHEATHQIAYNIGLHSRTGETPRWVVEGMATAFEPDGMRSTLAGSQPAQRINRERYLVFQNFVKSGRRPAKSLRSFIESETLYESAVLDFYAQSWALTFFLIETRPRNYSAYLKRIAARDPLASYSAKERLADFKETIHPDVDWLDVQFVKFIDGLK
jgi:hypothetical protein